MEEWKNCYIGDVCSTISETYKANSSEVVLVNTSDVLEGKCLNHIKVDNKDLKGQFKKAFHQNDILYSEIRPANKRFAFIDFEPTDYIASTKLMVIRNNESILPEYLFYILQSKTVIEELQMLAESRSGTFPQITFSEVSRMQIKLPNTEEQIKILGVLKSLDKKIELNRRINDNLEQQAQALFKSWFVDFEPFKDGKFVDSELGMIPEGWKVKSLKEFIYISKSTINPQKNLDKVFIHYSLPACDNGLQPETQLGSEIKSNKIILEDDTILFSKLNPRIKRIWFTSLVKQNSICSTEFIPFKAINNRQYSFVYSVINSDLFYNYILGFVNGATGSHQRFHAEDSLELNIPFNNAIIDEFCKYMEPILEKTTTVRHEISRLIESRDLLLPKLMSGELKINEINN